MENTSITSDFHCQWFQAYQGQGNQRAQRYARFTSLLHNADQSLRPVGLAVMTISIALASLTAFHIQRGGKIIDAPFPALMIINMICLGVLSIRTSDEMTKAQLYNAEKLDDKSFQEIIQKISPDDNENIGFLLKIMEACAEKRNVKRAFYVLEKFSESLKKQSKKIPDECVLLKARVNQSVLLHIANLETAEEEIHLMKCLTGNYRPYFEENRNENEIAKCAQFVINHHLAYHSSDRALKVFEHFQKELIPHTCFMDAFFNACADHHYKMVKGAKEALFSIVSPTLLPIICAYISPHFFIKSIEDATYWESLTKFCKSLSPSLIKEEWLAFLVKEHTLPPRQTS